MKRLITSVLLLNLLAIPIQASAEDTVTEENTLTVTQPADSGTVSGDPVEIDGTGTVEPTDQVVKQQTSLSTEGKWVEENGNTYYYIGGEKVKGWQDIEGARYYFELETGALQKGFLQESGNRFYLDAQTGALQTGWTLVDGKWYFFDLESGILLTGWIKDQNTWYYLDEAGIMQTGWIFYENEWYYLKNSGAMMTGWAYVDGKWYYLKDSGIMQTGWLYYQTHWYYLKNSGAMTSGWLMVDDSWYYFYTNGVMAKNTTIQGSYLGSNGAWISNLVNPKQTYSYSDMVADITKLKKNFPGFIETQVIGKSVDGRNIYAIKLGKGEKEIFFNGSHHAREHMTTNVLMEMLDQYASSYSANQTYNSYNVRELLNKVSIWFVPMVNPDGVMLVQEGHLTAKNPQYVLQLNGGKTDFSSWKANIRGVDLNRQYPADWANIKNNTGKPSPENFKGYQPLSEPEVQAVYNFVKAHHFKIATAYHSSGRILYWNFHQATAEYNRDYQIALKYSKLTGYSLVYPGSNPSGGGFTDWFIQDMKLPGFTPEISTATYSKPVPLANYDTIWKENQSAGLMLALEALKL